MRAVLDVFGASSMSCSCRLCPADSTYRWYKTDNGEARPLIGSKQRVMTPEERGTYACRFVWTEGRSVLSNDHLREFLQDTYQYQINDKCGKFDSYLPLKDLSHKHFHSRMFHLCFRSTQRHSNYSYNCDRVGGSSIRGCVCGCSLQIL